MSAEKVKTPRDKGQPEIVNVTESKTSEIRPGKIPPLFRRNDWLAFFITTFVIWLGYYLTLAPDLTLEDSGELATGSFYAGVPHPPGYPVWTLYTWLWTVLVPFKNIAWRVALGEATAGAVSCGLLALVVSRGSSMMIEGIADLKNIDKRWENFICIVSGFAAGTLLGFNGFMWSQSVIVEVYSFSVLSLMGVIACLLRWVYAPHQRRYLYWAWFLFGVCFTNHQTLIVAAMGIEMAVLATDVKLGRNLFLMNGLCYFGGLLLKVGIFPPLHPLVASFDNNQSLYMIFHLVGVGSLYLVLWHSLKYKLSSRFYILAGHFLLNALIVAVWLKGKTHQPQIMSDEAFTTFMTWINPVGLCAIYLFALITNEAEKLFTPTKASIMKEWVPIGVIGALWTAGALLYLYMVVGSTMNPPMNWGYARTVEGFFHALSRGQYERTAPSDMFNDPFKFLNQLKGVAQGIADEFDWVYTLVALIPFLFFPKMQKRERAWVIGITAIYLCLAVLLMILLNPAPDRQSRGLLRVFFTASHVMVAMGVGYGLTLIAASLATQYEKFRNIGILGGVAAMDFAFFSLVIACQQLLGNAEDADTSSLYGFWKVVCWLAIAFCFYFARQSDPLEGKRLLMFVGGPIFALSLCLTAATLLGSHLSFQGVNEFFATLGRIFNKDQYALPVIAGIILFAMAGLFLLAISSYKHKAPLAIILALFAATPIHSIMCNWSDNEQRGHMFGYWFGHDMFTPPYGLYPEMTKNAVLFGGTDPGRFCPTYMIFCESFIPPRCKPNDPNFDRRDVYIITQNALADGTYLNYIRAHYNRSTQIDPPFFQELLRSDAEKEKNYRTNVLARVAWSLLDKPLGKLGAAVEARRRREGVYPMHEIYTPTPDDSQRCFNEYLSDAQKRLAHDMQFPNEPRQIRQGEDVHIVENRVQVAGQVAVMTINGLLCKVIFDHNPTNEFFIEESFPLDWMYPYLTPFGVIMKINRNPLPQLADDVIKKDHDFWSQYSSRLIGNWITYDTSVKEIVDFVEKVYLRRDYSTFKGDRAFARDDQAQKAFSKLRSSIGGVYAWRVTPGIPGEYAPRNGVELQKIYKEADFAFKQAFAFCPYSPEAVFRYVTLLAQAQRWEDALLVAQTCLKLDPLNGTVQNLVSRLQSAKDEAKHPMATADQIRNELGRLEAEVSANPTNFQAIINLASAYFSLQQTNKAEEIISQAMNNPAANLDAMYSYASFFNGVTHNMAKVEEALEKSVKVDPTKPESWYNLAAVKAYNGKPAESVKALATSLEMNAQRLKADPKAPNLSADVKTDSRFNSLRSLPEFQKLLPP